MSAALQPLLLDTGARRLFAVLQPAVGHARAGVLICPPLLHEQALSYRLFALLGDALAAQGITVLRFDYHGTGDSAGDDAEFTLESARTDAAHALCVLREHTGGAPLFVLGVRAGALIAAMLAGETNVQGLWFWQPIVDGSAYLDELRRLDDAERRSTIRYPNGGGMKDSGQHETLFGFPCNAALLDQLAHARLAPDARWPRWLVLESAEHAATLAAPETLALGPTLRSWVEHIDMGHFPVPPVREIARELSKRVDAA